MRVALGLVILSVVAFVSPGASAQVTSTVDDGGTVTTNVNFDAAINHGSSMHRRWITVHNSALPLDIKGNTGMRTEVAAQNVEGFVGRASLVISAHEEVAAYEIRFLLFNVWGDFLRTYSLTRISDTAPGDDRVEARWRIFAENEVGYVHSIAYVARIMTRDGKVIVADDDAVLAEAQKKSLNIKRENLTPKNEIWLGGLIIGNSEISRQ